MFPPGGRKKALIIGIAYRGTDSQLNGCINDANCMKYMLTTK
jgi:metacaspase-1